MLHTTVCIPMHFRQGVQLMILLMISWPLMLLLLLLSVSTDAGAVPVTDVPV